MSELKYQLSLRASIQEVWHAWTDSNIITKWFSPHANIEPKLEGLYELFFDPNNHEHQCTKGCKITRFEPYTHLSFSWRGPDELHYVMDPDKHQTHVHVSFRKNDEGTEVTIIHDGWGIGKDWEVAKEWHNQAWIQVISSLRKYFNDEYA